MRIRIHAMIETASKILIIKLFLKKTLERTHTVGTAGTVNVVRLETQRSGFTLKKGGNPPRWVSASKMGKPTT